MGFFDFLKEEKTEERNMNTNTSITSLFGEEEIISEDNVLKIPTVKACVELIAGTIAQLPIYLYKETEDGSVERVEDYRCILLNDEPNELQTGYSFKKHMVKDYIFYGASYNYIERSGNTVTELQNLKAKNIRVDKYVQDGFRVVDADINVVATEEGRIKRNSQDNVKILSTFKPYDCIIALNESTDGVTSKGVLEYGKDIFKVAIEEKKYTSSIYKNGALPLGILKTTGRLTQPAIERLKASWQSLYSGAQNSGKTVVLEEGLDYTPVSLKPGDLLLTENRKDTIGDICKLFNIPESLVDVTKIKYGSLEQNNIHFLQYTLSPIITSIESGLNKSLLLEDEKRQGYFFSFDTSEVLRSTDREKYEAAKVAVDGGLMSINEARYRLNLPAIKDDVMKWTLGAVLYYPETGEMKIPNMGIGIDGYEKTKNTDIQNENKEDKDKEEEITDESNTNSNE